MIPSGYGMIPPPNSIVVPAGDPRIGGVLCGNCKGRGRVSFLFIDENCPVYISFLVIADYSCRGIGRIRS